MPSAADNVKVDGKSGGKNHPQQTAVTENGLPDSTKQSIIFVEHKIRNLEKRKSKLESYRDLQKAGKELNADQKTAVAKYDEVTNTLEFARDLNKQFLIFANSSEKEAKKQAKREATQRVQSEMSKIREIILVQDALDQMGNESVRADFLAGRNGAAKLTQEEMKLLDDVYPLITPKHVPGKPTAFSNEVQSATEHLLGIVEGKQKEVCGGTYAQIKELLGRIHESGYFDQAQPAEGDAASDELPTDVPVDQTDCSESYSREDSSGTQLFDSYNVSSPQSAAPPSTHTDSRPTETAESGSPRERHPSNQQTHPAVAGGYSLPPQGMGVVPVPMDEGQIAFYPPSNTQAPKPISDIVGDTSYIFLQESEIDEAVSNNICPSADTGPAAATATNGLHQSAYYTGQLSTPHPLPVSHGPSVGVVENSAGAAQSAAYPAALRATSGVTGPDPTVVVPVPNVSTNGTSSGTGAAPNNRRGGGGGSNTATQSSYYTNTTLETERAAPNFVPLQQFNANAHGSQAATTAPAASRTNYYSGTSDSSDRSFTRNNRSNQGNSRNALDCGFYSGVGGGTGGETGASSNRTSRGGSGASYYQNNSHGFSKNATRGQQQRSGNSRPNKIQ